MSRDGEAGRGQQDHPSLHRAIMRQAQPHPRTVLGALQKTPVFDYTYSRPGSAGGITVSSFVGRKSKGAIRREVSENDALGMIVSLFAVLSPTMKPVSSPH